MKQVLALLASILFLDPCGVRAEDPPAPYQRELRGEDLARVTRLEKQLAELRTAQQWPEAVALARKILDDRVRLQGAGHFRCADARWVLDYLEKLSKLSPDARRELLEIAAVQEEMARLERARRYQELLSADRRAIAVHRKHLGDVHPSALELLQSEAICLDRLNRHAEAEAGLRDVLDRMRKHLGDEHPLTANTYAFLASCLKAMGRFREAEGMFRRALELTRRVVGENHVWTSVALNNLGACLDDQGRHDEAGPWYREALAIARRLYGDESPRTAEVLATLGIHLRVCGKPEEAEVLYRRVIAVQERELGPEDLATINKVNLLAVVLADQGRLGEAEEMIRRVLKVHLGILGPDHPQTAQSWLNLAGMLDRQGRHAEAEPLQRRALAIYRRVYGERHPLTALAAGNLAGTLADQGKQQEAAALSGKVLEIRRQLYGDGHFETLMSYDAVASHLGRAGKHTEATQLYDRAIRQARESVGEEHWVLAMLMNNSARNLADQGRFPEAASRSEEALAISRRIRGEYHSSTAMCALHLGVYLLALRKTDAALDALRSAARSYEVGRDRVGNSGFDRASYGIRQSPLPRLAAALARQGKALEAWDWLEASLARSLLDEVSADRAKEVAAEDEEREKSLRQRLHQLDSQIQVLLRQAKDVTDKELDGLIRRRTSVQTDLARWITAQRRKEVYALPRIQEQIPADAALLVPLDLGPLHETLPATAEHWMCVVRREGPPRWIDLDPDRAGWSPEESELAHEARRRLGEAPEGDKAETLALLRRLAEQRLAPLRPVLAERNGLPAVQQLIVVPVGELAGVPLEALTDRFTISYTPSATLFARLKEQPRPAGPGDGPKLLALADPKYDAPSDPELEPGAPERGMVIVHVVPRGNAARAGLRQGDVLLRYGDRELHKPEDLQPSAGAEPIPVRVWRSGKTLEFEIAPGPMGVRISRGSPAEALGELRVGAKLVERSTSFVHLPGTRREVEAIRPLFGEADVFLGAEASAARLRKLAASDGLRSYTHIHLATHGVANRRIAFESALVLAQEPGSGNKRPGLLTAGEIRQHWKLHSDLVALSACESGLGKAGGTEGFLGFAQALHLAGSRSQLLSLWQVDDTATALLMQRFYQNLLGKRAGLTKPLSKAAALREAQEWLRDLNGDEAVAFEKRLPRGAVRTRIPAEGRTSKPYAHPYYWAAFVLFGDPE